MKQYKIQNRSQKNSQSCVPLSSYCFTDKDSINIHAADDSGSIAQMFLRFWNYREIHLKNSKMRKVIPTVATAFKGTVAGKGHF